MSIENTVQTLLKGGAGSGELSQLHISVAPELLVEATKLFFTEKQKEDIETILKILISENSLREQGDRRTREDPSTFVNRVLGDSEKQIAHLIIPRAYWLEVAKLDNFNLFTYEELLDKPTIPELKKVLKDTLVKVFGEKISNFPIFNIIDSDKMTMRELKEELGENIATLAENILKQKMTEFKLLRNRS